MTTRKQSTKKTGKKSKGPSAEDARRVRLDTLALMIAGVLTHRDTPPSLYDAMRFALAGLTEPHAVNEHPDVIRVALEVNADEKGGED